ncbi:MAG: alpha-L-rhamnosidase N-terminal domain-containing protein [Bacteroidetes bacterium]|nr:alpha-L-rhamnosidase N-terminal domain-containing protein [Bacteroidota bacterium]
MHQLPPKLLAWVLFCLLPTANCHLQTEIAPRILNNYWKARWLTCPGEPVTQYGVYHFRKTFDLKETPATFIVHVSADNRYRLFVNGTPVSSGPARSDLANWNFETVNIAPQLKIGKNAIAAIVWNAAEHKPFAQISYQTGFILQGNTETEDLVNTDKTWKVTKNEAYRPLPVDRAKLQTYMVTGDGDEVDASRYPWGWEQPDFDDSGWKKAEALWFAGKPRTLGSDGNWMLVPRKIPLFVEKQERLLAVKGESPRSMMNLSDHIPYLNIGTAFLQGKSPVRLAANGRHRILLDQTYLVNAYPELIVSGGKGSKITLTYAEALFDKNRQKGNRNETEGKEIMGIQDMFRPDGGQRRLFRPLWFRTWRYVQLDIETGDEPLTLEDFYGMTYGYPLEENASFKSSDPSHEKIWEAGWRTAQLCAGENYFDCPYYEQLQYVGDTRIQALISLCVSGDDRLVRKAIEDFDHSRIPDGLTQSRYPCADMQVIPTYSMFWISMIHDYWMYRQDDDFLKKFQPGMEDVLAWHEARIAPNGMLGPVEWWNFVDWSWAWNDEERIGGVPPGVAKGGSSILTLQFAYTLRQAAELYRFFGKNALATHYANLANSLTEATWSQCWDADRGLLADTPAKASFSQHANILAVLTDAVPAAQQAGLLQKIMADKSITQTTFYFRFYLFEALKKTGLGDEFLPQLADWQAMLDIGLTTFGENPEPTRSDCHAWSASPNFELLSTVLGIRPGSPGFGSVRIEPNMGNLGFAEGKMPHPKGKISVRIERNEAGVKAVVSLPPGLDGDFVWKGETKVVTGGSVSVLFFK